MAPSAKSAAAGSPQADTIVSTHLRDDGLAVELPLVLRQRLDLRRPPRPASRSAAPHPLCGEGGSEVVSAHESASGRRCTPAHRPRCGRRHRAWRLASRPTTDGVDLFFCLTTGAAMAAKRATSAIPIVFSGVSDPVMSGLVPSLARPGGNLTGMSAVDDELHGKRFELLRELLPHAREVAVLWMTDLVVNRNELTQIEALVPRLGVRIRRVELNRVEDIAAVIPPLGRMRTDALFILPAPWHVYSSAELVTAATQARLPTIGVERERLRAL
jgi:hypothetical protein